MPFATQSPVCFGKRAPGATTRRGPVELHALAAGDVRRPHAAKLLTDPPIERLRNTVRLEWGALDAWYEDVGGPLGIWREWAADVEGEPLTGGHFFPEENPAGTLAAVRAFLRR